MRKQARIVYLLVLLLLVGSITRAQESADRGDLTAVRQRIEQIMRKALKRSEDVTPEGVRISWRATPTLSDTDEVRRLGPAGVEVLSQLLLSQNPRECQLVVRMMGALDQSAVLTPMLAGVNNPDVGCRSFLIAYLRDAPANLLKPVLDRAATDPDAAVRSEAVRQLEYVKARQ